MQRIDAALSGTYRAMRDRRASEREKMRVSLLDFVREVKEDPAQHARTCEHCQAQLVPEVVSEPLAWDAGHERVRWPVCDCDERKRAMTQAERDRQERVKRERAANYARRLDLAGLTGKLAAATFDTFLARDEWPGAMQCKADVEQYRDALLADELENPFLILVGEFGTGKSHLAAAVIRECVDAGWGRCYFRSWLAYLERLKASYDGGPGAELTADIQRELREGRVVVLDDLDKREERRQVGGADNLAWPREKLYDALSYRENERLPTILTFNLPLDARDARADRLALEAHIGCAVFDRIIGATFAVVDFNGPSYRSGMRWQDTRWTERDGTGGG